MRTVAGRRVTNWLAVGPFTKTGRRRRPRLEARRQYSILDKAMFMLLQKSKKKIRRDSSIRILSFRMSLQYKLWEP